MPLKGVEEPAANLLKQWLINSDHQAEWKEGDDPPDLVFEVEGLGRWAVEVTELRQYVYQDGKSKDSKAQDGKAMERTTVEKSLMGMCDNIKQLVGNEPKRAYWLIANGPIPSPSVRSIQQRAIEYVLSGKTEEELLDENGCIRIKTFSSSPRFVWTVGIDHSICGAKKKFSNTNIQANQEHHSVRGGDKRSLTADIYANHKFSLERILSKKLSILGNLAAYQRRILLIWNSYYFGDLVTTKRVLAESSLSVEQLDSVFFVVGKEVHLVANPSGLAI